ncbi:hypothetical protein ALP90_01670 [Pseudomonas amygdali pv. ulmi]|uniref:Filamentous hemagglutinin, intein-containing n=1 Tax=Pseudomonas amygdali pv. ulmi TaxID=251720 RepID=A0A3M4SIU2_PSEA0|nr:hypothetical protein ALP90_01670 [Pseudomonas amygdali pv. ulmi]
MVDQSTNDTLANTLTGNGALIKRGVGSLNLTGNSSLSGATTVQAGRLAVNGNLGNSIVSVQQARRWVATAPSAASTSLRAA